MAGALKIISTVLGFCGQITGFGCYVAPLPIFVRIVKNRSTEQFSVFPYVCSLLSSTLWTFYGSPFVHNAIQVCAISSVGMLTNSIYIIIYLYFAVQGPRRHACKLLAGVVTTLIAVGLVAEIAVPKKLQSTFVGICGDCISIISVGSPLSSVGVMMRTKDVQFFPIALSTMNLINGIVWSSFATTIRDLYVFVPNFMGVLLGSLQIFLYLLFRKPKGKDAAPSEEMKVKGEEVSRLLPLKIKPPGKTVAAGAVQSPGPGAPLLGTLGRTFSPLSSPRGDYYKAPCPNYPEAAFLEDDIELIEGPLPRHSSTIYRDGSINASPRVSSTDSPSLKTETAPLPLRVLALEASRKGSKGDLAALQAPHQQQEAAETIPRSDANEDATSPLLADEPFIIREPE